MKKFYLKKLITLIMHLIENPKTWNPKLWNPKSWNTKSWNTRSWNPKPIPNYEIPNHKIQNHEIPNHTIQDHKIPNHEIPNHEIPNYEIPNHEIQNHDGVSKNDPTVFDNSSQVHNCAFIFYFDLKFYLKRNFKWPFIVKVWHGTLSLIKYQLDSHVFFLLKTDFFNLVSLQKWLAHFSL